MEQHTLDPFPSTSVLSFPLEGIALSRNFGVPAKGDVERKRNSVELSFRNLLDTSINRSELVSSVLSPREISDLHLNCQFLPIPDTCSEPNPMFGADNSPRNLFRETHPICAPFIKSCMGLFVSSSKAQISRQRREHKLRILARPVHSFRIC